MNSPTLIRFCPTESGSRNILTQGKDFYFDPFRFERHLIAAIDPLAVDLLRVALGVYVLDRVTRRKNRSPWSSAPRDMVIDIQVCRPEFWREPHIRRLIEEVLRFLSSDLWQVSFSQLARQPEPRQDALQYPEAKPVVCLYSGGLDSAAGLATWLRDNSEPVLAVCVLHQSAQKPLCDDHIRRLRNHYQRDLNLIPIRAQLMSAGRLDCQERTQRCRSFLFIAAGIVTAIAKHASRVLMFESGVGAVNAPMMSGMATGGRTTKSSHPYLLKRMSELATLIAMRPIDIELPYWQSTKAELVAVLGSQGGQMGADSLAEVARKSISCVHYPRHTKHRHCGVCPGCIGRRQAMLCAGIVDSDQEYEYDLFSNDPSRLPSADKLDFMKAIIAQVHDFSAINDNLDLPDRLRSWFLGPAGIATSEDGARPWLAVLRKYRLEWLGLAQAQRDSILPWALWLDPSDNDTSRYASGF